MVTWRIARDMCLALAVGAILCGAAACVRHSRHVVPDQGKTADVVQTDNAGSAAGPDANGQGASKASAKEVKRLQKAADKGDAKAQVTLAAMYGMGQGVPLDYVKAAELLQKAVDQGEPQAQAFLGRMYMLGLGVPKDVAKGCDLLRQAAATGDPAATRMLGFCPGDAKGAAASDSGPAEAPRKEQQ